jgi:hypothetical protein
MNTLSWPAALFQIVTMFILAWTGWIVHVVVIAFYALPLLLLLVVAFDDTDRNRTPSMFRRPPRTKSIYDLRGPYDF